ncbi:MAG: TIGR00282 family metallophosphoesterase [Ruminococcus sp.]|nr:TIGR00282 family metallophosphoesterase [Ruminococcus sp.]
MRILFIGDVVGNSGIEILENRLYKLKREYNVDFTIVNGENSAVGNGVSRASYERLVRLGADVVTGGNHSFRQRGSEELFEEYETLLRPANYPEGVVGKGVYVADIFPHKLAVVNLMGTVDLEPIENPFFYADKIISELDTPNIIIDFHAEATSEKKALGHYLTGRVTAVLGTHTHVQTADETILGGHTAYITDVGMCGPELSVLGVDIDLAVQKLKYHTPVTFKPSENASFINAVIIDINENLGKANKIERVIMR